MPRRVHLRQPAHPGLRPSRPRGRADDGDPGRGARAGAGRPRPGKAPGPRGTCPPDAPSDRIERYHAFAAQHESIVAKSLFSAGLTWPGIVLAEDRAALAYLAARDDVDAGRLACCGLSGGGLRTCFLAGMDDRIRVAVTVGFLTTWRDFAPRHEPHAHLDDLRAGPAARPGLPRDPRPAGTARRPSRSPPPRTPCSRAPRRSARAACSPRSTAPAGAPDAFRLSWHPGGHQFDRAMQAEAFDWIGRWLG